MVKFHFMSFEINSTKFVFGATAPLWARASSFTRFLDHTQRRTTVGRTLLDECSAHGRDLYLTTHNTHNRQTSMPTGGIRTHNLSRRAPADLRLRPHGHCDRQIVCSSLCKIRNRANIETSCTKKSLVRARQIDRQR